VWQHASQIDDCQIQNPAYRIAHTYKKFLKPSVLDGFFPLSRMIVSLFKVSFSAWCLFGVYALKKEGKAGVYRLSPLGSFCFENVL
jgi:hypothetical protein